VELLELLELMLELLLELLELLLLQEWVHVLMHWRWLPCHQQAWLQCPPIDHGCQWAHNAHVHPWPFHGSSAGQSQLVEGPVVGMLLGLLVACWPLVLLLLLTVLDMLLMVLVQELGEGLALQQLALLGMAAEAQMVAMLQALLIQLETVIWAHYLVQLMPSCEQQPGPFACAKRPDAVSGNLKPPEDSHQQVLVCKECPLHTA
jgi:hypothetical protein